MRPGCWQKAVISRTSRARVVADRWAGLRKVLILGREAVKITGGLLARGERSGAGWGSKGGAKSVLLVSPGGGLPHHDSFALKPDAPAEVAGPYKPIDTVVPGTRIGELLPRMARVMDKVALVRSGAHNNDH